MSKFNFLIVEILFSSLEDEMTSNWQTGYS